MKEELESLRDRARKEAGEAASADALRLAEARYLGRRGAVRLLFDNLKSVVAEQRKELGQALNTLRADLERVFADRASQLAAAESSRPRARTIDVTLPGLAPPRGRLHPIPETLEAIRRTFERLGFDTATGPEIETEANNFDALNMPEGHVSRAETDTYFLGRGYLLRTHTSPVQVRTMRARKPPVRIIAPGRVYRPDTPDASHSPMFHQVEGLMVGDDVTFAHLKGILLAFAKDFFGASTEIRFRPSYFPFTEPSAEVDVSCLICGGRGCSACKGSGWMEILGSGMVHPNVLRACGYDPEAVTGFAFGMGVERIAMLRHGITDIRYFWENHPGFLNQFPS